MVFNVNCSACTVFALRQSAAEAEAGGNLAELTNPSEFVTEIPIGRRGRRAPESAAAAEAPDATGSLKNPRLTRWDGDTNMLGSVIAHKSILETMAQDKDNSGLQKSKLPPHFAFPPVALAR